MDKLGTPDADTPEELNTNDYQDVYDPVEPVAQKPQPDDYTPESYDALITAELLLPKGDVLERANVIG
jgi:hypothetical protein